MALVRIVKQMIICYNAQVAAVLKSGCRFKKHYLSQCLLRRTEGFRTACRYCIEAFLKASSLYVATSIYKAKCMVSISNPNSTKTELQYLVRYSALGWVARFGAGAVDQATQIPHRTHVLIETDRGVELGEILENTLSHSASVADCGQILRIATPEDLHKNRHQHSEQNELFDRVLRSLSERDLPIEVVDAELLWDGESFICYYLGPGSPVLNLLAHQMSETWKCTVHFHPIIEPPKSEGGCGSGSCGCQH